MFKEIMLWIKTFLIFKAGESKQKNKDINEALTQKIEVTNAIYNTDINTTHNDNDVDNRLRSNTF